jgi:hypothetical protein
MPEPVCTLSRNVVRMVQVVYQGTTEMAQDKRDHSDDDHLDGWSHGSIMPYVNAVTHTGRICHGGFDKICFLEE